MHPDPWPVPSPGARATFPVSLSKARLTGALWGPSQHGASSGATSSASAWPPAGRNGPGTLVAEALEPDSSYPLLIRYLAFALTSLLGILRSCLHSPLEAQPRSCHIPLTFLGSNSTFPEALPASCLPSASPGTPTLLPSHPRRLPCSPPQSCSLHCSWQTTAHPSAPTLPCLHSFPHYERASDTFLRLSEGAEWGISTRITEH